ncbi:MAG: hypothetical protein V7K90_00880 [Nostoc sp.]
MLFRRSVQTTTVTPLPKKPIPMSAIFAIIKTLIRALSAWNCQTFRGHLQNQFDVYEYFQDSLFRPTQTA